jgi:Na+-transporting NADH:ubiquinone oxidoreductase subunit NqrB
LNFGLSGSQAIITVLSALFFQCVFTSAFDAGRFEARSALISALSLCLLLRVDDVWIAVLTTGVAIGSKFILRWHGTHVFNPTALAISVALLVSDAAWVSPGQWGHAALALLALAGLGLMVLTRAQRLDIALAFALAWTIATVARTWWYHDPLSIAVHQLSNGAVLLFCLFMLTDPRTTPNARGARVLFAIAVAIVGAAINFGLYRSDGLIFALALCAPLCVLLNIYWPNSNQSVTSQLIPQTRR